MTLTGTIARPGSATSLDIQVDVPPWLGLGTACQQNDPDTFFPWTYGLQCAEQIKAAKDLCAACPVLEACMEWGLASGGDHGIFGGLTPAERRRENKRRRDA